MKHLTLLSNKNKPMNVIIRDAKPEDVEAILEITNYAILHSTAIYDYDARSLETQMTWFNKRKTDRFPVVVAEYDAKVIGYGSYGMFRERQAYRTTAEHSVYVAEGFSGKGIGGKLLEELVVRAKKQGIHTLIGGIDASNHGSITFHKKHGFTEAGTIREAAFKFERWLDLLFMQRIL